MTLVDAESHIFEEEHKALRSVAAAPVPVSKSLTILFLRAEMTHEDTKHLSREEAEEALFLNQNKEITDIVINGRKFYSCERCRAMKLPLHVIQKHVASLVHKKNFKDTEDAAVLEQECKEMKKRGRVTTSYLCTPCGFTSDSIIRCLRRFLLLILLVLVLLLLPQHEAPPGRSRPQEAHSKLLPRLQDLLC